MSPSKMPPAVPAALNRMTTSAGGQLREARLGRRWPMRELARRAGVSVASVHAVESGRQMSLETYARLASALGLRPELTFESGRGGALMTSTRDVVHAAMGDVEAAHLTSLGLPVAIDEPYQHYQFAGRADVLAWNLNERRLLHIENKSRLDDIQDLAGSYNAKRAYLASAIGDRLGVGPRGWRIVSHVLVVLWSAEVLHVLRLRTATIRAICPGSGNAFEAWWSGTGPGPGTSSELIVLDPAASLGRARRWITLDEALTATRPRYRGYADVAARLSRR